MTGIGRYRAVRAKASPEQLVLLLYREAVIRLTRLEQLPPEDHGWVTDLHHVRAILIELQDALDHQVAPELTGQLSQLYSWSIGETIQAGRDRTPASVVGIRKVIESLLEGWEVVVARPKDEVAWAS